MSNGLGRRINRRNRGCFERRLTGPVENEASALAAKERHDERDAGADVFLINAERVVVDVEHRIVQLIHALEGELILGRRRRGVEDNLLEEQGNFVRCT